MWYGRSYTFYSKHWVPAVCCCHKVVRVVSFSSWTKRVSTDSWTWERKITNCVFPRTLRYDYASIPFAFLQRAGTLGFRNFWLSRRSAVQHHCRSWEVYDFWCEEWLGRCFPFKKVLCFANGLVKHVMFEKGLLWKRLLVFCFCCTKHLPTRNQIHKHDRESCLRSP